jgi:hypothetical protein
MNITKFHQLRLVGLWASFFLAAMLPLLAQSSGTSGLSGTITDPSGAAVPQVTVSLISSDTNQTRTATTGADGVYRFTLLPPGTYSVRIAAKGFKTAEVSGVQLTVTETAVLDRSLEVGAQTDSVTVEATADALQTSSSTLGTTVGARTVTELPLANRNYTQIIGLSAGGNSAVTNATSFGKSTLDISVNGNTNLQNNFQMDGVSIGSMGTGGRADDNGVFVGIPIINPDAIQEFKIQTSTYDASYGRNPGANVNVVSKSGTNTWHGTAFEFFRNGQLDANGFFYNRDVCRTTYAGESCPKQILNQNQYGGVIGGPIKKDKLFIFGSYEGTHQRNAVDPDGNSSINLYPYIPAGDRTSSAWLASLIAHTCTEPAFGPGLPCSATSISPVAYNMLQLKNADGSYYFPTHTSFGDPLSFSIPAIFNEKQTVVNGDYLISEKNTLAMRFLYDTTPRIQTFICGVCGAPPGAPQDSQFSNTNALVKLTTLVSNTFVNELRASMQRLFSKQVDGLPSGYSPANLGITPIVPSVPYASIMSFLINGFSVGGFLDFELSPTTQYQLQDQISWSHGKHTIRAGFEVEKGQWNFNFPGLERGWLFFGSFSNFLAANNPGNIFQCVVCVSGGNFNAGGVIHAYTVTNLDGFVQDDWVVSSRLTVNMGLRWESNGIFSDKYGNLTNFWPSKLVPNSQVPDAPLGLPANYLGTVVAPNYLSHYPQPPNGIYVNKGGYGPLEDHPPYTNFAPRLGFAYKATNRLVLRGGFGLFYDRIPAGTYFMGVEQNSPYAGTLDYGPSSAGSFTIQNPFPNVPAGTFNQRYSNLSPSCTTSCDSNLTAIGITPIIHTPLVRQYNVNLQYEFAPRWVLEAAYVGSSGINLVDNQHSFNTALLASAANPINGITTTTAANAAFRVPYLGYQPTGVNVTTFDVVSNYNSAQLTLRKQLSHGVTLQAAYTYSKSLTNGISGTANSNDASSLGQQYGPSYYNRPERFIINYDWELPLGQHNGAAGKLLEGWSLSGVTTIQDGTPITFLDGNAGSAYGTQGTGTGNNGRAQMCPGMTYADIATPGGIESRLGGYSGGLGYFNPKAFCSPPAIMPDGVTVTSVAACPTCATLFGNSGVGVLLGPGQFNFDTSVLKTTRITERSTLQFRAEFFNFFNHPQFSSVGVGGCCGPQPAIPNVSQAGSGIISSTSVGPRIVQFGLKFLF